MFEDTTYDRQDERIQITNKTDISDRGLTCGAGRCSFAVGWNGEMTLCHTFRPVSIDILKAGFQKSWSAVNAAAREYKFPDACTVCEYKQKCLRCPAEIEQYSRADGGISRICNRIKDSINHN